MSSNTATRPIFDFAHRALVVFREEKLHTGITWGLNHIITETDCHAGCFIRQAPKNKIAVGVSVRGLPPGTIIDPIEEFPIDLSNGVRGVFLSESSQNGYPHNCFILHPPTERYPDFQMILGFTTPQNWSDDNMFNLAQGAQFLHAFAGDSRMRERLKRQAVTDALTKLPNQEHCYIKARNMVAELSRGNVGFVTIAILDIDEFKRINDEEGHLIGDQRIIELANALRFNLGKFCFIGRFGGDEFVVITSQCSEKLLGKMAKIRSTIAPIKISVGSITISRKSGISAEEALAIADQCMQSNKKRHLRK